jgi:transposase-like protein
MSDDATDGRRRVRRDWPALVAAQRDSGQNVSTFCRTHGLSQGYFYKQRRELLDEGAVSAVSNTAARADDFIALPMPTNTFEVELSLGEGVVLRVRRR